MVQDGTGATCQGFYDTLFTGFGGALERVAGTRAAWMVSPPVEGISLRTLVSRSTVTVDLWQPTVAPAALAGRREVLAGTAGQDSLVGERSLTTCRLALNVEPNFTVQGTFTLAARGQ